MRVAVIGAGNIGGTLATLLVHAGHQIDLVNSRGPESLAPLVAELGPAARAATAADAAPAADIVVLAVPLQRIPDLRPDWFDGAVVIDTSNYFPRYTGVIDALTTGDVGSSEYVQGLLPTATVVKGINQLAWQNLRDDARPAGTPLRTAIPIAGDNAAAKQLVMELLDTIGYDSVDVGTLANGRLLQPGGPLFRQSTRESIAEVLRGLPTSVA